MKKLYLCTMAALCLSLSSNAQFTDDFESYDEGSLFNSTFTTWDGVNDGAQNAIVTTDQSASGTKSIFIGPNGGPGATQDAVVDLGGVATTGVWDLNWMMYIPQGNSAYINLQGNVTPNANANLEFLSGNITFANGEGTDDGGPTFFSFPHDTWFAMGVVVDLDMGVYTLTVDGEEVDSTPIDLAITTFGGLDLFAAEADNAYYIDDIEFDAFTSSIEDITAENLLVYPNPAQDELNISTLSTDNSIQILNVLGRVVLETASNSPMTTLDISHLASGTYYVNVSAGDVTRTVKVIK